jgi:hypothetical protein
MASVPRTTTHVKSVTQSKHLLTSSRDNNFLVGLTAGKYAGSVLKHELPLETRQVLGARRIQA